MPAQVLQVPVLPLVSVSEPQVKVLPEFVTLGLLQVTVSVLAPGVNWALFWPVPTGAPKPRYVPEKVPKVVQR